MKKFLQVAPLALSFFLTPLSFAEDNIMLVFDASGSMWSKSSSGTRLTTAKAAVDNLLERLPEKVDVGLTVYGHRRKGDCSDIQVYPSSLTREKIRKHVKNLTARGRTPLGGAIKKAARRLSDEDKSARIIALTDGLETCGVDLCALGQDIKSQGIGLTIDVVAYELAANEDVSSLKCLTNYTGGTFYRAEGFSGLKSAFDSIGTIGVSSKKAGTNEMALIEHPSEAEIGDKIQIKVNAKLSANKIYMLTIAPVGSSPDTFTEAVSETLQIGSISGSGKNIKTMTLYRHSLKPGAHEVRVVDMMNNVVRLKSRIVLYQPGQLSDTNNTVTNTKASAKAPISSNTSIPSKRRLGTEMAQIEHPSKAEIGGKIRVKINAKLSTDKIYMLTVAPLGSSPDTFTEAVSETLQIGSISGSGKNIKTLTLYRHSLMPGSYEVRVVDMTNNTVRLRSQISLYNPGQLSDTGMTSTKTLKKESALLSGRVILTAPAKVNAGGFINFSVKSLGSRDAVKDHYSVYTVPQGTPQDVVPTGTRKTSIVLNNNRLVVKSTLLAPKVSGIYELRIEKKSIGKVITKVVLTVQ